MSSFVPYYNEYTNNPSPAATERLQQKPPVKYRKTLSLSTTSKSFNWSKCLWIAFVIFACICLLVATIVPIVILIPSTSRIPSTG